MLKVAKGCGQVGVPSENFLTDKEHVLGISNTEGMARRVTGWVRVAAITDNGSVQVRYVKRHICNTTPRLLQPEVVRKTLAGAARGLQVRQVARPKYTTDRAELAPKHAGASRPTSPLHFGQAMVIVFPMTHSSTSYTEEFLLVLVELGLVSPED